MADAKTGNAGHKSLVTRFHLLLLGLMIALTATAYVKIPAATGLPVHWGLDGHPDLVWPRTPALLIFPAVALFLAILFAAIGWLVAPERLDHGRVVSEAMLAGLLLLLCGLQFSLILIGVGSDLDLLRILAGLVAVLLVLLGLALPRAEPNGLARIYLPWTRADRPDWRATHRITGGLMLVCGLGLGIVAWRWPDAVDVIPAIGIVILVPLAGGLLFSLARARM